MRKLAKFILICAAATLIFGQSVAMAIEWTDSGGDKLLDLGGAAAGTSTMGAYLDLGAKPDTVDYAFEMIIGGFDTAPVVGESVDLYFSQSSTPTGFDGSPTTDPTNTAEGTIIEAALKNLILAGAAIVYTTTAADELKISGIVRLPLRYVSPVVHNKTADALLSTADSHSIKLIQKPLTVIRRQ